MIRLLVGSVLKMNEKSMTLLTSGGVGYEIFPAGSLLSVCKEGDQGEVHIFTIVREQEISLYGFGDEVERELFQKLIGVSGIGPKIALQIVSTPVKLFLDAVAKGDVDFISRTPGLGKKTAQKLIIELKGKLDLKTGDTSSFSPAVEEALEALQNLGYDHSQVKEILHDAPAEMSAEDLVRFFLQAR